MDALTVHEIRRPLRRELCAWQRAALGLLVLSVLWNLALLALIESLDDTRRETAEQLVRAELARDRALEEMEKLARQMERDRQARAEQAAAYAAMGTYQYIGECTITAYCPCAACCGQWADGLTATGIPAAPGIVAVDPDVIPLGATVVIDGQRYLAADTGVTGLAVDVCAAGHQAAEDFGVRRAEVWIERGGQHG